MRNVILVLFLLNFVLINNIVHSQSYSTTTKSCGKCGKQVSSLARIGDICPYCGVKWGSENTSKSNTTLFTPKSNTQSNSNSTKEETVDYVNEVDDSKASKSETEGWILSKLNKYTNQSTYYTPSFMRGLNLSVVSGSFYENYKYSFDKNYLIVSNNEIQKGDTTEYLSKIPIYDLKLIFKDTKEYQLLYFNTFNETIVSLDLKSQRQGTYKYKSVVGFQVDAEPDLCKRLHKAFIHLKKFYKKPISSELF